ncbi:MULTISPECIES: hypothetical protein [Pantoea]|uniref:hypothetical protein n=1 Tax=Pantoea TaxID=53335 RepID=UPI001428A794|nr:MULTISPECIES: hypothetical protein [Pantoea]
MARNFSVEYLLKFFPATRIVTLHLLPALRIVITLRRSGAAFAGDTGYTQQITTDPAVSLSHRRIIAASR